MLSDELVAAIMKEREECAKLCDKRAMRKNDGNWTDEEWSIICQANELAADAIRSRSNANSASDA